MTYRIRLFLTHIATAIVAGYCVWYGLQVDGYSRLAFMVLFGASIVVPNGIAAWWLNRGLLQLELALTDPHSETTATGLPELDAVMQTLQEVFERQRMLACNVEELAARLGHSPSRSRGRSRGADRKLLTDVVGQLSRTTARDVGCIVTFGGDIAKGAHDTRCGAEEQIRTVEQAIASAESLSERIDVVTSDANAVGKASTEVAERAEFALDLIERLVGGMEDIRASVEFSEKKVSELGRQSEQIAAIVETIGNISARSDMLALNASIEAVRAGRDGRGFAVVAEEVRKLAENTAAASADISELVNAIQSEAHGTVSVMTEKRLKVDEEINRISEAGATLEEILRSSESLAAHSSQISKSTIEQLRRTEEVVRAMQQISTIASRIEDRGENIRHKTTDLTAVAQGLEETLAPMYHFGDGDDDLLIDALPPWNATRESETSSAVADKEPALAVVESGGTL